MGRLILVLLILLVFIISVSALEVVLLEPEDNSKLSYEINTVIFRCNVSGAEVAKLYTNISGTWAQTGSTIYGNDIRNNGGVAEFPIISVPEGRYKWNCFADQAFLAPANFTFSFKFPKNEAPVCNGTFPSITLQKNTPKTNVVNLNDYFSDPENDDLTFPSVSGDNNIDVTIKTNGQVDLSPRKDRVAADSLYFIANDGKNNDVQCGPMQVTIQDTGGGEEVNKTNTAPRIEPEIPVQTKGIDVEFWILSLKEYSEDDETSDDGLTWEVEGVDSDVVIVTINSASKEARFEPKSEGESTVTFILKDPGGLSDTQDIKITINSGGEDTGEDLESELETEILDIVSKSPEEEKVEIFLDGRQVFEIKTSFTNNVNISWFVDGAEQDEKGSKFEFNPEEAGVYKIEVIATKDDEDISAEWELEVKDVEGATKLFEVEDLCGNNITDEGENCETCAEDVKCTEGEICKEGGCVKQSSNWITGFSIRDINDMTLWQKIVSGVVLLIIVLVISILTIRTRNIKKRKLSVPLSSFDKPKKGFFSRFKKKKEQEFLGKSISSKIETTQGNKAEVKKVSVNPPSGLEPIIGFINSGLASGDSPKEIRKALLNSGWSRKQVKHAFKSIEK